MASDAEGPRRPVRRSGGGSVRRDPTGRGGVDGRIRLLRLAFLVFMVIVGGKAVALASSSQHLTRIALEQQTAEVALPAHRGAILDRDGRKLAVGNPQQTVYATPYLLEDPAAAAADLCDALRIRRRHERAVVRDALSDHESGFAYVARKVDPQLARAAVALGIPGVGSYAEEERAYPMRGSAAQVLGYAGMENTGLSGVELVYDRQLAGVAGHETVVRDPAGRALRTVREKDPVPGSDVWLTLDEDVQLAAENVLERAVRSCYAQAGIAIVMDPRSGEVLAMANVTKAGFHGFGVDPDSERNRAVTDQYEPGSIFKLVTISGALADGTITPASRFTLPPTMTLYDVTIEEAHPRGTVDWDVGQILQWSSNVGAVTVGRLMGRSALLRWIDAFGFGRPSGVGFPGDAPGSVPSADEWSGVSIVNIPMGQGIAVTPLQMADAFSTVANDGVAVRPRLVSRVGTKAIPASPGRRVIPASVARDVRRMLVAVVEKGTGTLARVPGYEVAGKTGTAQVVQTGGGYAKGVYEASFVGMAPADHPRLVVLVTLDRTPMSGGDAAAPAAQKIMRAALQHLGIAP